MNTGLTLAVLLIYAGAIVLLECITGSTKIKQWSGQKRQACNNRDFSNNIWVHNTIIIEIPFSLACIKMAPGV